MAPKLVRLSPIVCYSNNISSAKQSVNCGSDLNLRVLYWETFNNKRGGEGVFCVLRAIEGWGCSNEDSFSFEKDGTDEEVSSNLFSN
jgi:hypothetical protein